MAVDNLVVSPDPIAIASGAVIGVVGDNEFFYDEVSDVQPEQVVTILSYYFQYAHKLRKISATGNCIGVYKVKFNNTVIDKKRSTLTDFNCEFDYETGITIPANTTVSVIVENSSDLGVGEFAARILFSQK